MTPGTPDWTGAICAQTDADLWFPNYGEHAVEAKTICRTCPLTDQCLEYALADTRLQGIWGGTSTKQRQRIRNQGRAA